MTAPDVWAWRENGKHLPPVLRDFHDQKDLFKSIATHYRDVPESPSWADAQIYVIDFFLWFMAEHGYTLQKSRRKLDFTDLRETLDMEDRRRLEMMASILTPVNAD